MDLVDPPLGAGFTRSSSGGTLPGYGQSNGVDPDPEQNSVGTRRTSKQHGTATSRDRGSGGFWLIQLLQQVSPDHDLANLDLDPTHRTHEPGGFGSRAAKSDQSNAQG